MASARDLNFLDCLAECITLSKTLIKFSKTLLDMSSVKLSDFVKALAELVDRIIHNLPGKCVPLVNEDGLELCDGAKSPTFVDSLLEHCSDGVVNGAEVAEFAGLQEV